TITGSLTDTGPATGTGTLVVAQGATATLGTASSIHSVFDYGTLDLLGAMAGSINMEGNGAGSAVEFNTLNPSATITNFGLADTIVLASSLFTGQKAGTTLSLTGYSSKDVLTVTETLAAGGTQTDKITISGASNLALASFTQVTTSSGVEIELVPSNFTFTTTGSFENAAGYSGGVAPGDIIVSGETITIASGTATVTGEVLSNSGLITIASGADFIDTNTISGTGALIIGAGGTASLIGNTSLGSITDNGTLILGGTVTGPITIAGSASVTGSLVDTGSLSGSGTFTVGSGNAATLTGGAAVTNIADNGSLVVAGSVSSNITGTGTLATTGGASATLSGTDSAGTLADNGTLTVTGSLTDTGIASGTGTLAVAPGATVTLAAGSSIADIIDNGTLIIAGSVSSSITGSGTLMVAGGKTATLSGTDSLTGTLADAGTLIVTGSLTDSGAATGAGTLSIASGGFVTLAGGSSITTITDSGDLVAGGSVSSAISGIGTLGVLSGTSATLAATDSIGTLADNGTLTVTGSLTDTGIASGTGTLAVATGGSATLAGNTTLGSIIDNGSLTASGVFSTPITMGAGAQLAINGNFSDSDPITGLGTLTVDHGIIVTLAAGSSFAAVNDYGTLDLLGSLTTPINLGGNNTGSIIEFTGTDVTNGTLDTAITSFGYGDTIVLGSADFALNGSSDKLHESYNSSNGQLTITDSTSGAHVTLDLNLPAGDNTAALRVNDAGGQLEITLCFYPGTALATPKGEVKVEDIKAGDLLLTANGAKPVRWIGQSHIHTRFADPLRALPIRIRQGALGNGLPSRDLLLSPDHAICIDGILVQASALVNGTNIVREHDVPAQFTYYHVELDSHELLLAAGVQAESFVDNVDRMHFHNWDDRTAPDNPIVEMDLPRAKSSRQVPQAIRRRLGISQIAVA
ncbi:MAG TPA: Hint domain-containing protein, partial [Acidocella sp.]|nr:Hint domain-containing protein [Acidocella sp.]